MWRWICRLVLGCLFWVTDVFHLTSTRCDCILQWSSCWRASLQFQEISVLGSFYGFHKSLDLSTTRFYKELWTLTIWNSLWSINWSGICIFCKEESSMRQTPEWYNTSSYLNGISHITLCLNTYSQEKHGRLKNYIDFSSRKQFGAY